MVRWNLEISDKTDQTVRNYLTRIGGDEGDRAKFVDDAVRAEVLRRTVRDIQDRNADLTPEEAQSRADEAVDWARVDAAV